MAPSLSDLRRAYYGAASWQSSADAEYTYLLELYNQDLTAEDQRLEGVGSGTSNTAARKLEERWLSILRESLSGAPRNVAFHYGGGDLTDVALVAGGTRLWVGADWFDGGTIDSDDTYNSTLLPVRNGALQEAIPGVFTTALHRTGSSGIWLDAVLDGGAPVGRIWWPLCIIDDGGTNRVGCLLIGPPDAENPFGVVEAGHIVTLTAFGTYASHIVIPFEDFEVDTFLRDTTNTYIFSEHHPEGAELGAKRTRVARVANGSLLTTASWTFWNGSGWSSSDSDAVNLSNSDGREIVGDGSVAKIGTDHYVMINHATIDSPYLDVYKSTVPQGPFTRIARAPLPTIGQPVHGGTQIAQLPRIIPVNVLANSSEASPKGYSVAMTSRNILGATDAMSTHDIRCYAPLFVEFPHG